MENMDHSGRHPMDVDSLFRQFTVAEIKGIEKTVKNDIEQRKEDLRQMVGKRYRDIIEAADSIREMNGLAESILVCTRELNEGVKRLDQSQRQFSVAQNRSPVVRTQYDINTSEVARVCAIRLYVDLPELVWECLDDADHPRSLLGAVWLLLLAKTIAHDLALLPDSSITDNQRQLIDNSAQTLKQLRMNVHSRCLHAMQSSDSTLMSAERNAPLFTAFVLLEPMDSSRSLQHFLQCKQQSIDTALSNEEQSGRQQLCSALSLLKHSLAVAHSLYLSENENESIKRLLGSILEGKWMPDPFSDYLTFQSSTYTKSIPPTYKEFRPSMATPFEQIDATEAQQIVADFMQTTTQLLSNALQTRMEYFETVESLATLKTSLIEAVSEKSTENSQHLGWDQVCVSLFGSQICLWNIIAKDICDRKTSVLLSSCVQEIVGSYFVQIQELPSAGALPTPSPSQVLTSPTDTDVALRLKAGGISMRIYSLCQQLDQELRALLAGVVKYEQCGTAPTEHDTLQQSPVADSELMRSLSEACQQSISRFISDVQAKISGEENIEEGDQQYWRTYWLAILGLVHECPSLRSCITGNDRGTRGTGVADKWNPIVAMLTDAAVGILCTWSKLLLNSVNAQQHLSSVADARAQLMNAQEWHALPLKSDTDSKSAHVDVPVQCSNNMHLWLHALAEAVTDMVPHKMPLRFIELLNDQLCHCLADQYRCALSNHTTTEHNNQSQRLHVQLLFDCRVAALLFAPIGVAEGNSGHKKLLTSCDVLEQSIDPFDLDVLRSHLKQNAQKCAQRVAVLYGILLPPETAYTLSRSSSRVSAPTGASNEPAQLLPLVKSDLARIATLPIAMPSISTSVTGIDDSLNQQGHTTATIATIGGSSSGVAQESGASVEKSAASFYDKLSSTWFGY